MSLVGVVRSDGATVELEMNDQVVGHAVDDAGAWLGIVAFGEGAHHVSCSPPATSWRWDFALRAWQPPVPTLAERKEGRIERVQVAIELLERRHQRSIRAVVDALLNSTTPPADDVQHFNDITASIAALQARRRAIADAQSQAELDAVPDN